jgi:hypothetical protein
MFVNKFLLSVLFLSSVCFSQISLIPNLSAGAIQLVEGGDMVSERIITEFGIRIENKIGFISPGAQAEIGYFNTNISFSAELDILLSFGILNDNIDIGAGTGIQYNKFISSKFTSPTILYEGYFNQYSPIILIQSKIYRKIFVSSEILFNSDISFKFRIGYLFTFNIFKKKIDV